MTRNTDPKPRLPGLRPGARARSAAAAVTLCGAIAACHPVLQAGNSVPASRLVIAVPQEPPSLNTLLTEGPSSTMLDSLVYSFLLTFDSRGNLVPDLAAEVPSARNGGISADGRTITYRLRKNVVWQDGVPLTARDVVFTQHAIMSPSNNVFSRYGFERVLSIAAPDPYTVRIRLRTPFSPILTQFFGPSNNYGIVPEHVLGRYANINRVPFNGMPIGSGPYRVKDWIRGDHLTLLANPTYFRGPPKLQTIVLKFVADSGTVLNQLRTGEVDAYFFSDPTHMAEYEAIPAVHVSRAPFAAFGDLIFNLRDPTLADPRVRRAIVEALNLPQIVRNATRGTQTTADPNLALFGRTTDASIAPSPYDPAAARAFLAPRRLSLQYAFETGKAVSASTGVQLQQQLRAAGVNLTLRPYSPELFRAQGSAGGPLLGGTFQIGFFEIFTTGDWDSSWYLSCTQVPPAGFDISRFCDPVAERAVQGVLTSYDEAEQRRLAAIVQRRVSQLVPYVSLWSQNAIYVTPTGLRGFAPSSASPYWNAWAWSLAGS
jgi:peptide/nickel transport system substrate-binding protein